MSDQTIEQRLDEIQSSLYNSGWVEGSNYKENNPEGSKIPSDRELQKIAKSKQSLLQLLNEARTKGYNDGFQMGQFDRDMDNTHGIANQTIEQRLYEILPCISCGSQADPADGFGTCTCGNERLRQDILQLLNETRIETLDSLNERITPLNDSEVDTIRRVTLLIDNTIERLTPKGYWNE